MARDTRLGRFGTGRRGISRTGWALRGAAAGAAASTALNAATYLDMAARGRPSSSTPEKTVEAMAGLAHVEIPGDDETRQNRLQGLGPLVGTVAGVGVGVVVGLVRASGFRSRPLVGTALTTAGILVAANGPMTVLGVTDPRTWSAADWISDLVPHAVYGAVVKATMDAFDRL
jgi:hypothetical protein